MSNRSYLTLWLAIFSAVFFLLLIFFRMPFPLYSLMSWQDVLDLLTPVVLIPIYWLTFRTSGAERPDRRLELAFMICASVWVLGHGLHLAANSIDNLAESLARKQTVNITTTDIYTLTYFFDEHLSHVLWHAGILGLAIVLIVNEAQNPMGSRALWPATIAGGVIYGLTYFSIFLEGQTVVLGLPAAILIAGWTMWQARGSVRSTLTKRPILSFFLIACLLAALLFGGWGIYWRGFPQFSDVGLI